jgi:hypothetical protein
VIITRLVDGQAVTGTATNDSQIQPGDTISVRESWF